MLARALVLGVGMGCLVASCGKATGSGDPNTTDAAGAGLGGAGAGAAVAVAGDAGQVGEGGAGSGGGAGDVSGAGAAGDPSTSGEPITAGLVVVGTTVPGSGAAAGRHFVVLLDPADGHELARTQTTLDVLGIAHEALRDKWFVFTGTPGQSADATGPLLVGSMTTAGFEVEQTVLVPKPTNQNTIIMLNQRILYRTTTHVGASQVDDTLALIDTSAALKIIGKLTIPFQYALVSAVGAEAVGAAVGGRAFFLHDNLDDASDNCVAPSVGTEAACTVYTSSLPISAADTNLTLQVTAVTPVAQIDRDGSDAALGVQPSGSNVVIVVPPRRALDTHASVYRYDSHTGVAVGAPLQFSLETEAKKVDPTNSITIPTVAVDPCAPRLFTGELANTGLLYAVPFDTPQSIVAFDPASHDGIVGAIVYEPFSHTLISYNSNSLNPTFSGLALGGTASAPQIAVRGLSGAPPWNTPQGLVPSVVAVKNPVIPPCE